MTKKRLEKRTRAKQDRGVLLVDRTANECETVEVYKSN